MWTRGAPRASIGAMSKPRDRLWLALFALYVAILVLATIGELFGIDAILNLFDLKKLFSV